MCLRTFIQVILKNYIGGFRPHFLEVCNPDAGPATTRSGFGKVFLPLSSCRGMGMGAKKDKENLAYACVCFTFTRCCVDVPRRVAKLPQLMGASRSLQSFPSGHTSASFAVGVFLFLYINAKLKVFFVDYSPSFWKYIFCLCPIIGAGLIGGGLHVDHVKIPSLRSLHMLVVSPSLPRHLFALLPAPIEGKPSTLAGSVLPKLPAPSLFVVPPRRNLLPSTALDLANMPPPAPPSHRYPLRRHPGHLPRLPLLPLRLRLRLQPAAEPLPATAGEFALTLRPCFVPRR
jgi:hypothetical protein